MSSPRVSVVVATYNRKALLLRLLRQLAAQRVAPDELELIVVDDGSAEPVAADVEALQLPCRVEVITQANAGAAAARHAGVACARGDVIVLVDDDMQVAPDFLAEHLAVHDVHPHAVVLGRIAADPALREMPLFERYNAWRLERWERAQRAGAFALHGNNLCTGNVSFRREDYEAVGGFDLSLRRSEDAELGLRLEAHGVFFTFRESAVVQHGSDHTSWENWLQSARRYGAFDLRIARKHAHMPHADPWRYLFALRAPVRPFLAFAAAAPHLAEALSRGTVRAAEALDRRGLESLAIPLTGIAYGVEYFRGIRGEAGSLSEALESAIEFLTKIGDAPECDVRAPRFAAAAVSAARDFAADRAARHRCESRYGYAGTRGQPLGAELATKIGLQLAAGYRLMRLWRAAGVSVGAKITSRFIRHLYGSDIHWDAELAPGTTFVHGFGLAISHAARVGPDCVISQNVTLGMGIDPVTRETGGPTLGAGVHVGAGAVLIGPITVGAGSKVMPNVVLTTSVPPGSLVEAPVPHVRPRLKPQNEPLAARARSASGERS
ncbi:MAG: glycosyltransferase [Deltaproteobacteria bacterium]|nr:glycosyltransferase [Deltaproteobacteria bacterium]